MNSVIGRLGDAIKWIEAGKSVQTLERLAAPDEPGILKVSAISWGRFDASAAKALLSNYHAPQAHQVRRGDLLFSRANTLELTGAVAMADDDYPYRYLSDKTLRLVVKTDRALPEYLLFALRSTPAREHIELNATGSSASMRNISQAAMLATPLPLPSLARQREITQWLRERLEAAEYLQVGLKAQLAEAERLPQRILAAAFGG